MLRQRVIAGVAYWFARQGNVTAALLVDYDDATFETTRQRARAAAGSPFTRSSKSDPPRSRSSRPAPGAVSHQLRTAELMMYTSFAFIRTGSELCPQPRKARKEIPLMHSTSRVVFSRNLTDGSHVRRFDVEKAPKEGWQIRDERDDDVRQVTRHDWHRVELAIMGFTAEAAELKERGWEDQ